jgi:hypothetical protein
MNQQLLFKNANKHKKWFEQVYINPFGYEINGTEYFLAIYQKGNDVKGYSVISVNERNIEDASKAFKPLMLYTAFSNTLFKFGEQRAKINPHYFSNISQCVVDYGSQNNELQKGKLIFAEFENLQREFINHVNNFTNHYDNTILQSNKINDEEYDRLITALAHLNRIQFLQGEKFLMHFGELKNFEKTLKKEGLEQYLPNDTKKFLKELLSGTKETEETIKPLEVEKNSMHLPLEQQIIEIKKSFYESEYDNLKEFKTKLRYPKL